MGKQKTENLNQHKRLNINFAGDSQHEERLPRLLRACRQNPLIADRSPLIVDRQVGRYSHLLPYMWLGLCWWRRSVATIYPMVSLGSHGQANIRFRQIWFVTLPGLPPLAPSAGAEHYLTWAMLTLWRDRPTKWAPHWAPCWHTWPEKGCFVSPFNTFGAILASSCQPWILLLLPTIPILLLFLLMIFLI